MAGKDRRSDLLDMKYQRKNYKTVWEEDGKLFIINQNLLPEKFMIIELKDLESSARAIEVMQVRGAPAIGAVAAFAYALEFSKNPLAKDKIYNRLLSTRPTAVDLKNALNIMRKTAGNAPDKVLQKAREFAASSEDECRRIGETGNMLIKDGFKILTHCNAGALATVDHGTALAPIRAAHNSGRNIFVFVDETRPRLQGARLTAFELAEEGIPHAVIADNAAGFFMYNNEIDLVITGADRIAKNGDIANKIGTYAKAVVAKENDIPFYIAAPWSTFDNDILCGKDIPIEERDQDEVLKLAGIEITSGKSPARNPAFDVTPHRYITGYITPAGIFKPNEMEKIWEMLTKEQNS